MDVRFFKKLKRSRDQYAKTPTALLEKLETRWGRFDFDPCPADPQFNGLEVEWGNNNYVNPPFNNLRAWLTKALAEWEKGKQIILIMPIRLHTKYFLDLIFPKIEEGKIWMYIIRGALKFQEYKWGAPFGMMYLVFPGPGTMKPKEGMIVDVQVQD